MDQDVAIECLFSHRCNDPGIHELGHRIADALAPLGINVGVDKLCTGDEIRFWSASTEFECVIFVASELSWLSHYCRLELETAKFRSAPIFLVHSTGGIPDEYKDRLRIDLRVLTGKGFEAEIERLALAIRERVQFARQVRTVRADTEPIASRDAARNIAVDSRPPILAEHAYLLARVFRESQNDECRYWVARAIGRAGTPQAKSILTGLRTSVEPSFGRMGVEEALIEFQGPLEAVEVKSES